MTPEPRQLAPVALWPDGPPDALGDGPAHRPTLVPVLPGRPSTAQAPAIIVCPGGGYDHLAEHEGLPVARRLTEWPVTAFVLRYRVKPYFLPAALADGRQALRRVREQAASWNVDPSRVAMMGFSAGGHLAACMATFGPRRDRPDALVGCYAPFSLVAMNRGGRRAEWLLGEHADAELHKRIELDRHVSARCPPTFLWTTAADTMVPPSQSLLYARALWRAGVSCRLHVFSSGLHGLGLSEGHGQVSAWPGLVRDWLSRALHRTSPR